MGQIFGPIWSASKLPLEALFYCHMKCSISQNYDAIMEYSMGKKIGTIWSASKLTLEVSFNHPIECSISKKFDSIWSTPWDKYGLLQMYKITNKTTTKNYFAAPTVECCSRSFTGWSTGLFEVKLKTQLWHSLSRCA